MNIDNNQSTPTVIASFSYDVKGNQTLCQSEKHYEWDYADRMRAFYNQTGTGVEPTVYAVYLYDGGGNRTKKLVRKQGGVWESVTYIGDSFEYHKKGTEEKNYTQIANVEIRTGSFTGDGAETTLYQLKDHLGSVGLRLNHSGSTIDREEYYPFGDSSLRTFTKKRYRYCGKEKDEESGLYYYGARYYMSWAARFISIDPLAADYVHLTPYNYAGNKPITYYDIDGMQEEGKQPVNGNINSNGASNNEPNSSNIANGIKTTQEGADLYMRGFEKLLGDLNPFYYDKEKGAILYNENKLENAKNLGTCEQLEIIKATSLLVESDDSSIFVVDWETPLPHRLGSKKESLMDLERGAETATYRSDDGKFLGAEIFIARNAKEKTDNFYYTGAKYDRYGNLISYDEKLYYMRPITTDETVVMALHELMHGFLRATQPNLSEDDHNKIVENFEATLRKLYPVGVKKMKMKVDGFGTIKYKVPTFMGGEVIPHKTNK